MKRRQTILCVIGLMICLLLGCNGCGDMKEEKTAVFGVISDMHYEADDSDMQRRTNTKNALEYYKNQNVDVIIFNGDINNLGTTTAYEKLVADITEIFPDEKTRPSLIFTADNHEYYDAWSVNGHAPTKSFSECQELFTESLSELRKGSIDTNTYFEVNGYHFIGVSSDGMSGAYATYSEDTIHWLGERLEKASRKNKAEGNEAEPIFLAVHQPLKDTVCGSDWDFSIGLDNLLKEYPQLIVFTSHTHIPLQDERSIHQRDFTSVNTGTLYYAGVEGGKTYSNLEEGGLPHREEVAQGLLVRVNGTRVDIERRDFYNHQTIGEHWVIENPAEKDSYIYTDARKEQCMAPQFTKEATGSVIKQSDTSCTVTFDSAEHENFVHHYKVSVMDVEYGYAEQNLHFITDFYTGKEMTKKQEYLIEQLNPGCPYSFQIYAVDCFGNESDPFIIHYDNK